MDLNTGGRDTGRPSGGPGGEEFDRSDPVNSFVSTARSVVLNPGGFFRRIARRGDYLNPLLFAAICGLVSGVLGGILNLLLNLAGGGQQSPGIAVGNLVGGIIFTPIFTVIGLFVGAGIYHLLVMLFVRPSNAGFEATFRVASYISVTQLVSWIPILGPIAAFVYGIVLSVLGIREMHSTSTGRAALIVLLPSAVVVLLVLALAALIGAAVFLGNQPS